MKFMEDEINIHLVTNGLYYCNKERLGRADNEERGRRGEGRTLWTYRIVSWKTLKRDRSKLILQLEVHVVAVLSFEKYSFFNVCA